MNGSSSFYHNEKPYFISHSLHYNHKGSGENFSLDIYLDIDDKKNIIRGLYYEGTGKAAVVYFEELSRLAKAWEKHGLWHPELLLPMPIEKRDNQNTVLPLAQFLCFRAILEYRNQTFNITNADQKNPNALICRCFGIYEDQLEAYLEKIVSEKSIPEIGALTGELKLGGGCTRCLEQVFPMMADKLRDSDLGLSAIDDLDKYRRFRGFTPAQLLLKVDDAVKVWQKKNESIAKMELLKLQGMGVYLHFSGSSDELSTLEKSVQLQLRLPLFLVVVESAF